MNDEQKSQAIIDRIMSLPRTHQCVITYADGDVRRVDAMSAKAAENHAVMVRRVLNVPRIHRETGKTVMIVKVEVVRK